MPGPRNKFEPAATAEILWERGNRQRLAQHKLCALLRARTNPANWAVSAPAAKNSQEAAGWGTAHRPCRGNADH
eukprot:11174769-Lingulodinium_polyedra.AAC.1